MVLWGGVAAGVLLLAGLVWQLGASVAKAEERVERRRQDLAFIESVTPRLQTLPTAARPGEPLTIAVDRMAREGGLADKLAAVEPASNGGAARALHRRFFDSLTLLLARLQKERGVEAETASVPPPASPASSTRRSSSTATDAIVKRGALIAAGIAAFLVFMIAMVPSEPARAPHARRRRDERRERDDLVRSCPRARGQRASVRRHRLVLQPLAPAGPALVLPRDLTPAGGDVSGDLSGSFGNEVNGEAIRGRLPIRMFEGLVTPHGWTGDLELDLAGNPDRPAAARGGERDPLRTKPACAGRERPGARRFRTGRRRGHGRFECVEWSTARPGRSLARAWSRRARLRTGTTCFPARRRPARARVPPSLTPWVSSDRRTARAAGLSRSRAVSQPSSRQASSSGK